MNEQLGSLFNNVFKKAHQRFGQRTTKMNIIGIDYWDRMKLNDGSYAYVDERGRSGVVVCIDIYRNGEKVSSEAVALFERYSSQQDPASFRTTAVGFGEHKGPRHVYAMCLERQCLNHRIIDMGTWETLIESGEVEVEHEYVAKKSEKFKYVLR